MTLQPELRWLSAMPNLHLIRQEVERALADQPADIIVLPEVFNGILEGGAREHAENSRQFLRTLARTTETAVVGGSMIWTESASKPTNSCFVVDSQGQEVGVYHKRVMFGLEQTERKPGSNAGIFEIAGIRVGVLICADFWQASLANELIDDVDLLCVPAKTTVMNATHTDYARSLWWNLALTRAMETGIPVAVSDWACSRQESSSASAGRQITTVHYTSGGSSIVDPGQRPAFDQIQQTLERGRAGTIRAKIVFDRLHAYRTHRREVGLLPKLRPDR